MIPLHLTFAAAAAVCRHAGEGHACGPCKTHAQAFVAAAFAGMREQCARCGCGEEFHEGTRCGVCMDFCPYRPAWVLKAGLKA